MSTYQQGVIVDGITTVYGLCQRITKRTNVEIATARDENGEVAAATQFNPEREVQFEYVYDSDETLPDMTAARATPVTLEYDQDGSAGSGTSANYLVDNIEDVETNDANYRRAILTCRRWLANGVPA